jgi:FKBP-type peptidyl-prolyl cis-trans isomerase
VRCSIVLRQENNGLTTFLKQNKFSMSTHDFSDNSPTDAAPADASMLDDSGLTPQLAEAGYEDVTPSKDGGVLKLVLQQGNGTDLPCADDHVFVHYEASLRNGKLFDDSRKRDRPFTFVVGKGM